MINTLKIKVCGTRDPENIRAIQALGVEMIGMIFYEKSARYVSSNLELRVATTLSPSFGGGRGEAWSGDTIGIFVNAPIETIASKVIDYQLNGVQLHGQEDVAYIIALKEKIAPSIKIFKAVGIDENFDFELLRAFECFFKDKTLVDLFVFDTKTPQHGGSGVKFDWTVLERYQGNIPFLLSGGIGAEDADAIQQLKLRQLYGVDLNSKFEIEPALKDIEKLKLFILALRL
ncbi:MAG: hypothetical protein RLZZ292_2111 [Bacteroidota bacterium]|jgi:phosphoribosylanthranilate isomerase